MSDLFSPSREKKWKSFFFQIQNFIKFLWTFTDEKTEILDSFFFIFEDFSFFPSLVNCLVNFDKIFLIKKESEATKIGEGENKIEIRFDSFNASTKISFFKRDTGSEFQYLFTLTQVVSLQIFCLEYLFFASLFAILIKRMNLECPVCWYSRHHISSFLLFFCL